MADAKTAEGDLSPIALPADALPTLVSDFGLLMGLLTQSDGTTYFDLSWFQTALNHVEAIPAQRAALIKLLRDLLGTPAANTPTGRAWYLFKWEGHPTYVYVVLPLDDSGADSTIGFGILHTFEGAGVTIQASVYVPLFVIPVGSPVIVTGSSGYPLEFVLTVDTKETFTAGEVSFTGLQFTGSVYFTGAVPGYALSFIGLNPPQPQSTFNTLAALQSAMVSTWVNALLGTAPVDDWVNTKLGQTPFTIGGILSAVGILTQKNEQYVFGSFNDLVDKTPAQIAAFLLGQGLTYLATYTNPIVSFAAGGIWIYSVYDGAGTAYGLGLQLPDIDVSPTGGPTIKIQLGKVLSTDTDNNSWISRSDPHGRFAGPGIWLTLLAEAPGSSLAFQPRLDLISIGLDVSGTQGNPLFNINGAQLSGVEPRMLLSLDFANLTEIVWGVAVGCADLGFPLGNGLSGVAGNPVAQNLLSSGTSEPAGDKEAINPTFSASVAQVFDPNNTTRFDFNLQQSGSDEGTVWIPVQRSFGPLECSRIGIQWPDPNPGMMLTVLFDGGVKLAVLEVDLYSLSLGIPLSTPGQLNSYALDLAGLAVSYAAGPVAISGGLLKDTTITPTEYEGEALIQAATWAISAISAYASLNGHPSLFIFAQLAATIGGPPVFFVTGLCAGFGYNRSLVLPTQDAVADFPLLAGISDPGKIGGPNATPTAALAALSAWVPPAQGVNWLAAGVQFTSFELIQSNAVVAAVFGKDFEIAILGLSRIKLPQVGPEQFAYAELQLEVILHPSPGFFGATATLTPNSYVIVPAGHLTGGFAFSGSAISIPATLC